MLSQSPEITEVRSEKLVSEPKYKSLERYEFYNLYIVYEYSNENKHD